MFPKKFFEVALLTFLGLVLQVAAQTDAPTMNPAAHVSAAPTQAPSLDVIVIYNNLTTVDIGLICATVIMFVIMCITCYLYCSTPSAKSQGYSQV
jgi:hypothetical protein